MILTKIHKLSVFFENHGSVILLWGRLTYIFRHQYFRALDWFDFNQKINKKKKNRYRSLVILTWPRLKYIVHSIFPGIILA